MWWLAPDSARADVLPCGSSHDGHPITFELVVEGLTGHADWVVVASSPDDPTPGSPRAVWKAGAQGPQDLSALPTTHPTLRLYPAEGWAAFEAGGPLPAAVPCPVDLHFETWTPFDQDADHILATWTLEAAGPAECRLVEKAVRRTSTPSPSGTCSTAVAGWGPLLGALALLVTRRRS